MKQSLLLILALPLSLAAQDLSTEIVVDRTIEADLPAASPAQNAWPAMVRPQDKHHELRVADYTMTADYQAVARSDKSKLFNGLAPANDYRGFAWLGYFPSYNLGGGLGYRAVASRNNTLDVAAAFEGASWHGYRLMQTKPTFRYNTFSLNADYSHLFNDGAIFTARADYAHDGVRKGDYSQGYNHANIEAGYRYEGELSCSAEGFYRTFSVADAMPTSAGQVPGASTRLFGVKGNIESSATADMRVGMALRFEYFDGKGSELTLTDIQAENLSQWAVGLTPHVAFERDAFSAHLGLNLDICKYPDKTRLHVSPDVSLTLDLGKRALVYVQATGGESFTTLGELYDYSVFAPGFALLAPQFAKVDGRAGVRLGDFSGFTVDLHAGYSAADGVAMPRLLYLPGGEGVNAFASRSVTGWYAGFEVNYKYGERFAASASARAYTHGAGHGCYTERDNARGVVKLEATYRLSDKLLLGTRYELRACRFAYAQNQGTSFRYNLGNVSDLGVNVSYEFSRRLSFFCRAENLLCRRSYILPGIPGQRLHGLLGAAYKF